jgi:hypothetical protein
MIRDRRPRVGEMTTLCDGPEVSAKFAARSLGLETRAAPPP